MRSTTSIAYLAAILTSAGTTFAVRSAPGAEPKGMVVTWTKPGRLFRAREVTVAPQGTTLTDIMTIVPTVTLALRSVEPTMRNTKHRFLNGWSFQGCAVDDGNIPPMVSPFPYQLATEEISSSSCMHFCSQRGNSLAALQNGNECWCGELEDSLTYTDKNTCNIPCAAEPGEMCGGEDKLSVYARAS